MKTPDQIPVELPESLRGQFRKLQSRLFAVDTVIATCGVLLGAFLAFNIFFISDLAAEMPKAVRLGIFALMAGTMFIFVRFWLRNWVYHKRDTRDLSNIVQRARDAKLRSPAVTVVGDVVRLRAKLRWFDNRPLFRARRIKEGSFS